jgi:hypothetical protein
VDDESDCSCREDKNMPDSIQARATCHFAKDELFVVL